MYLTYEEYLGMGGSIDQNAFTRLEAKARSHIDRITFGRLCAESPVRDSVKYCMYDLLGAVQADEANGAMAMGREITSMSNDGVSITFSTYNKECARYTAIVRTWLAMETDACGVPLMYPGVCVT